MLFSATQTDKAKELAKLSFTERPLFISVRKVDESATVA